MQREIIFECCCTGVGEVVEAMEGGASRIELCEELWIGGVTPSVELITEVLDVCRRKANASGQLQVFGAVPVNVLVRPRGGDFVYSEEEAEIMLAQIETCKRLGVNGVVIGALNENGDIDVPLMKRLIAAAAPLKVTFHRAFDECRNPGKALEDIIALGCRRLLSSGQAKSADEGRELLSKLVRKAGGRIIIMPGAGINPGNIARIAAETGASEYHGSAHGPDGKTDRATVSAIVNILNSN